MRKIFDNKRFSLFESLTRHVFRRLEIGRYIYYRESVMGIIGITITFFICTYSLSFICSLAIMFKKWDIDTHLMTALYVTLLPPLPVLYFLLKRNAINLLMEKEDYVSSDCHVHSLESEMDLIQNTARKVDYYYSNKMDVPVENLIGFYCDLICFLNYCLDKKVIGKYYHAYLIINCNKRLIKGTEKASKDPDFCLDESINKSYLFYREALYELTHEHKEKYIRNVKSYLVRIGIQ